MAICRSGRISATLVVLLTFFVGVAAAGQAGKMAVPKRASGRVIVEGVVERVSGDSIFVKGKEYRIAGIPIEDPSGKAVKLGDVTPGNVAELFFKNKQLYQVLTYIEPFGGRR